MALTDPTSIDVGSASNVLLLTPTMHAETDHGCGTLLAAPEQRSDALLSVLTVESPESMLDTWGAYVYQDPPESAAFLLLGSQGATLDPEFASEERVIHPIANPSNLTALGVATSDYLSQWQQEGRSISCCFQSITTLHQYVESRVVYRFLHQFAQQISSIDAVAHYHMDPSAHEPAVINTMLTLFDAVVELEGDSWRVRSRSLG